MCDLSQKLRIILFCGKVMFYSQDIQVFVFLAISWFTKSVTAWWVLVHETKNILEYISFEPQLIKLPNLVSLIDIINKGNNFQEPFEEFGGLELSFRFFLI